jgi:hypothetical protein
MRLNPPKKNTFWISVAVAAVGVAVYLVHLITTYLAGMQIPYLQPVAILLVVIAFVLLCLGLTLKGL